MTIEHRTFTVHQGEVHRLGMCPFCADAIRIKPRLLHVGKKTCKCGAVCFGNGTAIYHHAPTTETHAP